MSEQNNAPVAVSPYYDLFKFFHEQHNLILLDSEIQEIVDAVNTWQEKESNQEAIKNNYYGAFDKK